MGDLITRYIREYQDDAMTDPTMMYVDGKSFRLFRDFGRGFCFAIDGGNPEVVLQVYAVKWDDRTLLVSSINVQGETFKKFSKESNIDVSSLNFAPINEIVVTPKMYEYQVVGVSDDGAVLFSEGVEVECRN